MLVLSRKEEQSIWIGRFISLTVKQIQGNRVSIAIEAPQFLRICRDNVDDSEIDLDSITLEVLLAIASQCGANLDQITPEVVDLSDRFRSLVQGAAA